MLSVGIPKVFYHRPRRVPACDRELIQVLINVPELSRGENPICGKKR